MVKRVTTLNLDSEIVDEAKRRYINLSEAAEKGIKDKLNIQEVDIKESLVCEYCGHKGEKETKEDIKLKGHFSEPTKLTWLWPDEKWICNSCLKAETNRIIIGHK